MHLANTADADADVGKLLEAGARTNLKNKEGKTLLQIAREQNREKIVQLLESKGVTL